MFDGLLSVKDLMTTYGSSPSLVRAVDGVSFDLQSGSTLGIVGESGSGKSATALSIPRLLPASGRIVSGSVLFEGRDLVTASSSQLRRVRGGRIGYVFQDPMRSLNPLMTAGDQIAETIVTHTSASKREARQRAAELLDMVGIADPVGRLRAYPHELSGGMRQRVMVAMAIACNPSLLIADEPTTALDVTIQAQMLELLGRLQSEMGMALILISHDLRVVASICDRVMVMYAGRAIETATAADIFARTSHPYTSGLLDCQPHLRTEGERLQPIPGSPPDLRLEVWKDGCAFAPRCTWREEICTSRTPSLEPFNGGHHQARCWVTQRRGDHLLQPASTPATTGGWNDV